MTVYIRAPRAEDVDECGRICYEAFAAVAGAHNFAPDFPNPDVAASVLARAFSHPASYAVVAEENGRILGSNILHEGGAVSGIGPITVDPDVQNKGIGTRLMRAVMERSAARGFAGIRLVQAGYHCRSLSLYSKLGFEVREHLSCFQGRPIERSVAGYDVRLAQEADIGACNAICRAVHGLDREGELRDQIAEGCASVVQRNGHITGYATGIAFFGYAVGETNDDLKALIADAHRFLGPGFLVPSRNGALMRWCLENGLRITQTLTLMTLGLYSEPAGAWLPSILY